MPANENEVNQAALDALEQEELEALEKFDRWAAFLSEETKPTEETSEKTVGEDLQNLLRKIAANLQELQTALETPQDSS